MQNKMKTVSQLKITVYSQDTERIHTRIHTLITTQVNNTLLYTEQELSN